MGFWAFIKAQCRRVADWWQDVKHPPSLLDEADSGKDRHVINYVLLFLAIAFSLVFGEALKAIIQLDFQDKSFRAVDMFDTGVYLTSATKELVIVGSMTLFFAAHAYVFSRLIECAIGLSLHNLIELCRFLVWKGHLLIALVVLNFLVVILPALLLLHMHRLAGVASDGGVLKNSSAHLNFFVADLTIVVAFFLVVIYRKLTVNRQDRAFC